MTRRSFLHLKRGHLGLLAVVFFLCSGCLFQAGQPEAEEAFEPLHRIGLRPETISGELFFLGKPPKDFSRMAGADYKPSYNEDPAIPAQCWIETGYGTQNACQYCHTDYLADRRHGNAFPIADDQILYSFPTPALNRILWRNIIAPEEIDRRLAAEGVSIPGPEDVAYVREDNWSPLFEKVRKTDHTWLNRDDPDGAYALFPALNPNHLFPCDPADPTDGGRHGYVDPQGFVRDENDGYTGWRAINFFPYAIFKPQSGSVSGVYIRLPKAFMTRDGKFDLSTYTQNLELLERNIKNRPLDRNQYHGDAAAVSVHKGFYPVHTEFAHPLHYVDLNADGDQGQAVNGVVGNTAATFEFPGTRSKRVKEIRYMYKWKAVDLDDIADTGAESEEEDAARFAEFIGREGQGWVDNNAGWILAGYIENRHGELRPQTTEELTQCIGCHGNVGNTVDAVWSFQRKLPGELGWREMDYGQYRQDRPDRTRLHDYLNPDAGAGELAHFYSTVVGADLYGVMSVEISQELQRFARRADTAQGLALTHSVEDIFDDERLKTMGRQAREARLRERQRIMRLFAGQREHLYRDTDGGDYIKGAMFYPSEATMRNNIQLYRKIVLDQSYNLGKDVFGSESDHVPFTFRSDGSVVDEKGKRIAAGEVITSRPYGPDGIGTTPTGIVAVNADGVPVDRDQRPVDLDKTPERASGHIANGGTFNPMYNPILSDTPVEK